MENQITFEIRQFGPVWFVGKATTVAQGKTASAFVKRYRTDGSNARAQALPARISPAGDLLIWMGEYDAQSKSFTEIPGVLASPGSEIPEGFTYRELPACTMGICTVRGANRDITRGAHNKLLKAAAKAGFAPDYSFGYSMEYYPFDTFEQATDAFAFSYYLPCKKL